MALARMNAPRRRRSPASQCFSSAASSADSGARSILATHSVAIRSMAWLVSRSSTGTPFFSLQLIRGFGGRVSATGEPISQPANAPHDMFFDRVLRQAHAGGDFPLAQATDAAQDKSF